MSWVAVAVGGAAVIGAGVSLYGINQQANENASAQAANQAAQATQNQESWNNYLMERGLNANGSAPTGVIPTTGTTAVNTKLPLWANVSLGSNTSPAFTGATPAAGAAPAAAKPL